MPVVSTVMGTWLVWFVKGGLEESQYGETRGACLSSQVDHLFLARLLDALLAGVEGTLLALGSVEESLLCGSICNEFWLE
jgi:hypothetical protein